MSEASLRIRKLRFDHDGVLLPLKERKFMHNYVKLNERLYEKLDQQPRHRQQEDEGDTGRVRDQER